MNTQNTELKSLIQVVDLSIESDSELCTATVTAIVTGKVTNNSPNLLKSKREKN